MPSALCAQIPAPDTSSSGPLPMLRVHAPDDPQRAEVEAFIRQVYAQRYGADVRHYAPTLVSLRDAHGIVAAAGYRCASSGPLFLERYFDVPIETLLARSADATPARDRIIEVGHLSAARAGAGRHLIGLLARHLQSLPHDWVVSTMTTGLRHMFLRMGIRPWALGVADPDALGPEAAQWGRYYEHHPIVLAGRLPQALSQLTRHNSGTEPA